MINDEYDFEAAYYEAEIIRIWDALPDYVKTSSLWSKIKNMATTPIINQLQVALNNEQENAAQARFKGDY